MDEDLFCFIKHDSILCCNYFQLQLIYKYQKLNKEQKTIFLHITKISSIFLIKFNHFNQATIAIWSQKSYSKSMKSYQVSYGKYHINIIVIFIFFENLLCHHMDGMIQPLYFFGVFKYHVAIQTWSFLLHSWQHFIFYSISFPSIMDIMIENYVISLSNKNDVYYH